MTRDETDDRGPTTASATPPPSRLVHDLNNALAAIGAFSHLIRTDPALPDDLRTQADWLVREAERARVIAAELVATVRPGSAPGEVSAHEVPASQVPARDIHPAPADTAGPRAARVLVVDDEASIREFLSRVLVRSGHRPVLAASGGEALAVIQASPPDAILCDHRMTGMSGTELHAAIVALAPQLATRFAFMSGDVFDRELQSVAASGSIPVLAKPFELATIGALVDQLLDGRGSPEWREA